jgi:hypothetical protein
LGIIRAIVAAAVLAAGATAEEYVRLPGVVGIADETQGYITREWRWSEGDGTTVFTAFGPPEQVNAFDPHGSPLKCPDCLLASSMQIGPSAQAVMTQTAD